MIEMSGPVEYTISRNPDNWDEEDQQLRYIIGTPIGEFEVDQQAVCAILALTPHIDDDLYQELRTAVIEFLDAWRTQQVLAIKPLDGLFHYTFGVEGVAPFLTSTSFNEIVQAMRELNEE